MSKPITLSTVAILDGYTARRDGSFSLRFVTNELSKVTKSKIDDLFQRFGILYFKGDAETLTDKELKELSEIEVDLYDQGKSKAKIFKNVLWRNWDQDNQKHETFDTFYAFEMEKVINHYKNKLD